MSATAFGAAKAGPAARTADYFVYVGTFTGEKSRGIYVCRFDAAIGRLTALGLAAETPNPSFVAIHPNRQFLYAVNAIGNFGGRQSGAVSAFTVDSGTGKLALLNQQATGGAGPCHLAVDHTGRWVLAANYGGGSVVGLPIRADGSLGEATAFVQHVGSSVNPRRQAGPHAHFITTDPANRFALACDLGLDKVLIYRFDSRKGALTPNNPPWAALLPGAGPRHLAFHPRGRFVYVINELNSTLTAFAWEARRGALREMQTVSTLPNDFQGHNTTAEVLVHPSGKFVYGSNRGHDSLAVFSVHPKTGKLTYRANVSTQGKTPRNFVIDPTGRFLLAANQESDTIVVFGIDLNTGCLHPTGYSAQVPVPVCLRFVPAQ